MTENKIQIIKNNISIVDVIRRYSNNEINPKGWCLCFAHKEKTPSMKISQSKNKCYCFGCGYKGDSVDVVKTLLNVDTQQAIEILGKDFNLPFGNKSHIGKENIKEELIEKKERESEKIKNENFIFMTSNTICNKLYKLRKICVTLNRQKSLSQNDFEYYVQKKAEIARLEEIYMLLNELNSTAPKVSKNELIYKLKNNQIKI